MLRPDVTRALCTATLIPRRDELSPTDVLAAAHAAAAAGFDAVTLWAQHHAWAGPSLVDHHAELGLGIPLVEVALSWLGGDRAEVAEREALVLDVAERCGARSIVAATTAPGPAPISFVAAALRSFCEVAHDRGTCVSFEFLPWSAIPDLDTAVRLVELVDHPAFGLVLDAWHWHHQPGGPSLEPLARLDPAHLHVLQLDDAPREPVVDPRSEGLTSRLLPGHGTIDLVTLLRSVWATGAEPIIAPEVFSRSLAALGPHAMARSVGSATDEVIRAASASPGVAA